MNKLMAKVRDLLGGRKGKGGLLGEPGSTQRPGSGGPGEGPMSGGSPGPKGPAGAGPAGG
jgi:hypothetical protein